jgi:hypothetical protein
MRLVSIRLKRPRRTALMRFILNKKKIILFLKNNGFGLVRLKLLCYNVDISNREVK